MTHADPGTSIKSIPGNEDDEFIFRRIGTEKIRNADPIQLKRVTMKFGSFTAVDRMSLSIQQDEIVALLGHNGAGKTTAIYMLTGMYNMSSGDATLFGKSIRDDLTEVRKQIGLCQQLDVLYDMISLREHLKMTMRVRLGRVEPNEDEQIDSILTRC